MAAVRGNIKINTPGKLWFGSIYSSIEDMLESFYILSNNSVKHIWNLLEDDSIANVEKTRFNVIHTPVVDYSIPSDTDLFKKDADIVLSLLNNGESIYVHCHGGHGRTGMAILYLKVLLGENPQEALDEVRELVRGPEMIEQIVFATGREDLVVKKIQY